MKVRIGDICTSFSGFTPAASELFPSGKYPYFKVAEMNREANQRVMTDTDAYVKESRKYFPKGSIVFPKNGAAIATNKKRILGQDSIVDLNTGGVEPNNDLVRTDYLFYLFQHIDFAQYMRRGAGPTLDLKSVLAIEIELPSLSDQQYIVAELDLLSGIIEKKNAQLRTLERLAESLFIETFGNLIANDRNWRMGTLNEFIEDKKRILRATKFYKPDEVVHYIDISSIDNKAHSMTSTTEFVFNEAPSRAQQIVQNGDVLVSMVRPNLRNVAIVSSEDKNLVASSGFCVLRSLSSNGEFLKQLVLSDFFTDYLLTRVSGANYPAVREEDIKECKLGIPPAELQLEFSNKIKALETERLTIDSSLKTTQDLLASRMDKYFSA